MVLFALRCFLFCIANHVRPTPSFDFCSIPLHLWPTIRSLGDRLPSMCPLWGKDYIPWCCSGCFYVHCERCRVSCLAKVNPHSSTSFSSIFSLVGQHCFINQWHLHIVWCCHCRPHSNKFNIMDGFFSWGVCYSGGLDEGRPLSRPLPNKHVFSSCHKGFWVSSPIVF